MIFDFKPLFISTIYIHAVIAQFDGPPLQQWYVMSNLDMSAGTAAGAVQPAGFLRRALRSRAFRRVKYWIFGSRPVRRLFTRNFSTGYLAMGERNAYAFPMGWVTLDWREADFPLWLDCNTRLPFGDASQKLVYAAHVLEHVEEDVLSAVLKEAARVLKPGGAIRIEVPDAEKLVAAYRSNDRRVLDYFLRSREVLVRDNPGFGEKYLEDHLTVLGEVANYFEGNLGHVPVYAPRDEFERRLAEGLEPFNHWAQGLKTEAQRRSGGHANALTYERLERALKVAGFTMVRRADYGRTSIPGLRLGRGWRRIYDSVPETPERSFYSLYVEAFR